MIRSPPPPTRRSAAATISHNPGNAHPASLRGRDVCIVCRLQTRFSGYIISETIVTKEGNKRVSVLRYFDAVSVTAHVFRILPEKNDSRESELYFEFVDFYRVSKINFLEFSKPGGLQLDGRP